MSWITSPLGKITTVLSGTTPESSNSAYWNGNLVWVTPTDLGKLNEPLIKTSSRLITAMGRASCNLPLVPQGAVVMSSRAPIGHLGIAGCSLHTNQGSKSFVCSSEIDPEFLYYTLKHRMADIQALGSGATFVEVSKSTLEAFEISFPKPIEKQRQIAARLKAQLAEVDKARQAAEAQLRDASLLVARYREKTIKQLEDVPRVPLGELLHGIEAGKSFQTTELIACPDELGVLKVSAVSWNEFLPQEAKAVEGEYQPDERHKIKKGDLIISRANTLELVGAVVRVADDYPMRLLSDKTLRLVVNEEMVLPDYLLTVLKLPEARSHIENNATGTSDSMRNISQKTINSIPVPVLTFDQQRELINRFSQFNEEMALVQKSGKAMLNDINLLPQKILAQAFEV